MRFSPSPFPARAYRWVVAVAAVMLLIGCRSKPEKVFRFYQEQSAMTTLGDGMSGKMPISGSEFTVGRTPIIFEGDVEAIELVQVDLGLCVLFEFGDAGRRELYRASVRGVGRRIFLFVNDEPLGARVMDGAITDGKLYMFLEVPDAELPVLVEELRLSLERIKEMR